MSKKSYPSDDLPEIRITVGTKTHNDLHNIANNAGVSLSNLLRPKLAELANSYPDQMKLPVKKD